MKSLRCTQDAKGSQRKGSRFIMKDPYILKVVIGSQQSLSPAAAHTAASMKSGKGVNKNSSIYKVCHYHLCPSRLHSNKWRTVTRDTNAGGRDWEPLVGLTVCDSCYANYRKHGTFVRSLRKSEGGFRVESPGAQSAQTNICEKPKTHRAAGTSNTGIAHKQQDPKASSVHRETRGVAHDKGALVRRRTLTLCLCDVLITFFTRPSHALRCPKPLQKLFSLSLSQLLSEASVRTN